MSANHSRAAHIARFKGRVATHAAKQENAQPGEVCIANIGTKERRLRLRFGVVAFAAGVLALAVLIAFHADPALRLLLFVPFAVGISSYFQWRDKTWVNLAMRGSRNMDNGIEQITEKLVADQIRKQAVRVVLKAVVLSAVLAAAAYFLPL